jgi:hypothetical protein
MAKYTADLQESFRHIDGEVTTLIPVQHNQDMSRRYVMSRRIGILAAFAAISGIATGLISTQGSTNNQLPSIQSDVMLPQQPNRAQDPSAAAESPKVVFGPTDFSLEFKKFSTEDGCKSFGSVVVKDQVLTAQIGAQPYAISIASATTEFYTCTNEAKVSYKNGELNTEKNAYPEIVSLDATSLTYGAVLKDVEMSMNAVTPEEQLEEDGTKDEACKIFDVCKIDSSNITELPKEISDVVLASAKAQIVVSAQDTFAKIEHKAMVMNVLNDLYEQADALNVSRDLVQFMLVNSEGKVVEGVPNFGSPLLKTTLKEENAAVTRKDLKGIFGDVSLDMEYIPNEDTRG